MDQSHTFTHAHLLSQPLSQLSTSLSQPLSTSLSLNLSLSLSTPSLSLTLSLSYSLFFFFHRGQRLYGQRERKKARERDGKKLGRRQVGNGLVGLEDG